MTYYEVDMVKNAINGWDLAGLDFRLIENVGNLVCPGDFDLDEDLFYYDLCMKQFKRELMDTVAVDES